MGWDASRRRRPGSVAGAGNRAGPLAKAGVDSAETARRVDRAIDFMGIGTFRRAYPSQRARRSATEEHRGTRILRFANGVCECVPGSSADAGAGSLTGCNLDPAQRQAHTSYGAGTVRERSCRGMKRDSVVPGHCMAFLAACGKIRSLTVAAQ